MIVTELTQGVVEPFRMLMNSNASPHDYALKPSDVKKVHNADMLIWFGPDLEAFLTKVIGSKENVIKISDILELNYENSDMKNTAHEGHDHGESRSSFWLRYQPS